jgi:hypothetical protein
MIGVAFCKATVFETGVGKHSLTEVEAMTLSTNKTPLISAAAAVALLLGFAWAGAATAAVYTQGDGPIACHDFRRGWNGSWTALSATTISSQGVVLNVAPGNPSPKTSLSAG